MSPAALPFVLAETTKLGVRWHAMPAAWVFWMIVVPVAIAVGWWAYQRDRDVPRAARLLLGALRSAAIVFLLLVLFGPFREVSETRVVRSHLLVLVDTSSSMATVDGYEPDDARALAAATGRSVDEVGRMTRLDLARETLSNPAHGLLERLTKDFRVHVYGFGSQLVPISSTGDAAEEDADGDRTPAAEKHRARLRELRAVDPGTRIGQAVSLALDAYRLRDEDVAGVVVVSDGQQNGGSVTPLAAGRKALAQRVPIHAVGVGDPRSPKNIHVANLRAKEVVLARDTAVFDFEVHAKGFEGRTVPVEVQALDDEGGPRGPKLAVNPSDVVLTGGDEAQTVRVTYKFENAGTYGLRIGIPVQDEEKIKSDNFVLHTVRVIDRKIKVLYVEETPRWEFQYLSNALCRDRETMLTHTLLLDADPEAPQRRTNAPEWPPLDPARSMPSRSKLFEYDVIVLGDVDPRSLGSADDGKEALANLRDFVERGGGLIFIAGASNSPAKYRDTTLAVVLPVVVDRNAEREQEMRGRDTVNGFGFVLTKPDGEDSPMMNVAGDLELSKRLWRDDSLHQYWNYPALRAKTLAKVLAESDAPSDRNAFGARPLIATMAYGRGRTLFIGVDELWRMRKEVGDKYFYRFYGEAVRYLATYKMLGGNKRFKIMTDLQTYTLDDPVHISVDVLDRDYEPSRAETQTVKLDMPGAEPGRRESVDLVVPQDPGETEKGVFRKTIVPTRPGDYRLTAATDDPKDEAPETLFHVVQSSLEGRDLLLNEASLREMAGASAGGAYLYLADLPDIKPTAHANKVPTNVHEDEIWDNGWTLAIAVALLGLEWLLRKRWRLV